MALQEKIISCGVGLTIYGMLLRFIVGPGSMAIGCIAVGLHGDVLNIAVIQVIRLIFFFRQTYLFDIKYKILL